MLEFKDLQVLVALAQHQHFAKAAEACHLSQPAFSMRIRALEDKLGVAVVRRGNRFQGLTAEGEMMVRRAKPILDDMRSLHEDVANVGGPLAGTLVMGIVPTANTFGASLVVELHKRHPGILVQSEVTSSTAIERMLVEGSVDAGVTYRDSLPRDDFNVIALYRESYVLCAAEALLPGASGAISWSDAGKLPLSLLGTSMQNRRILDRFFALSGVTPNVRSETNSFLASIALARSGHFATILPRKLIEGFGVGQDLSVVPLEAIEEDRELCLATAPRAREFALITALREVAAAS